MQNTDTVPVYVLMGTCGCGKTTIAQELVNLLECPFIEGDTLHPKANVEKMSHGIPLTDDDRWQWLESVRGSYVQKATELLQTERVKSRVVIATCSSLRKVYRDILTDVPKHICRITFVYLEGSYQLIKSRINERKDHFMGSRMLDSQWKTLEVPDQTIESVIVQDISQSTEVIAKNLEDIILKNL